MLPFLRFHSPFSCHHRGLAAPRIFGADFVLPRHRATGGTHRHLRTYRCHRPLHASTYNLSCIAFSPHPILTNHFWHVWQGGVGGSTPHQPILHQPTPPHSATSDRLAQPFQLIATVAATAAQTTTAPPMAAPNPDSTVQPYWDCPAPVPEAPCVQARPHERSDCQPTQQQQQQHHQDAH